jgi:dTMP kinase
MANLVCRPLKLRPHRYPGALITFCGVDGAGKSSLVGGLEKACSRAALEYLTTHTPTRRIRQDSVFRELVADPCNTSSVNNRSYRSARRVNVLGLLLSIMGDLVQHTTDTIIPALERGHVVFCDRYVFTSQAEIAARSNLRETEPVLARIAEHVLEPDLAFGLSVSSETSRSRVLARNDANDQPPPMSFLTRQVAAYRAVFEANDLLVLDAERGLDETLSRAMSHFARIERSVRVARAHVAGKARPATARDHDAWLPRVGDVCATHGAAAPAMCALLNERP